MKEDNWYRNDGLHLLNLTFEYLRVKFPDYDIKDWAFEDKDFLNMIKILADMVYEESAYIACLEGAFNAPPINGKNLCDTMSRNVTKERIIKELIKRGVLQKALIQ